MQKKYAQAIMMLSEAKIRLIGFCSFKKKRRASAQTAKAIAEASKECPLGLPNSFEQENSAYFMLGSIQKGLGSA